MDSFLTLLHTNRRRVKETILQSVGVHHAHEDPVLEAKMKDFHRHAEALARVREAMQIWSDAVDALCAAQVILADSLSAYLDESHDNHGDNSNRQRAASSDHFYSQGPYRDIATALKNIQLNINNNLRPVIHETFYERCLQPTEAILSLVPAINEKYQERKAVLLDFDAYNARIESDTSKGKEANHKTLSKLDKTTKELAACQGTINHALDEFNKAKPHLLGSELAAVVSCMYYFASASSGLMGKLLPFLPQASSTLCIMCEKSQRIQQGHHKSGRHLSHLLSTHSRSANAAQQISHDTQKMSDSILTGSNDLSGLTIAAPIVARSDMLGGQTGGYGESHDGSTVTFFPMQSVPSSSSSTSSSSTSSSTTISSSMPHTPSVISPLPPSSMEGGHLNPTFSPNPNSTTTSNLAPAKPKRDATTISTLRPLTSSDTLPPPIPASTPNPNNSSTASTSSTQGAPDRRSTLTLNFSEVYVTEDSAKMVWDEENR